MNDLIERIEAASAELSGALIEEAWEALAEASASFRRFACGPCSGFGTNAGKFSAALEARAFESAAIMLVPEGWTWMLDTMEGRNEACVHGNGPVPDSAYVTAATPALALCAAALKARAYLKETNNAD